MIDHVSNREQSESIKLLEDRVAGLMDGHDHNMVSLDAQTKHMSINKYDGTQIQ